MTTGFSLNRKAAQRMLPDDGTFGVCLQVIALAAFGPEIYELDTLELLLRLEDEFSVKVTEANENKLNAILLATSTDAFYQDPGAFRSICETLANGDPGIDMLDDLTTAEAVFGMYEVELVHGQMDLAPAVQSLLETAMSSETLEPGSEAGDDAYGHVYGYLADRRNMLVRQLQELGLNTVNLPPVFKKQVVLQ